MNATNSRTPILACMLASCALLAAPRAVAQEAAQPRLPVITVQAGLYLVQAEVADTPRSRAAGLMWRRSLGPNEGMLFVFESREVHCFWMRNTLLPLSIAFLDDDGRIVNIADMEPRSEDNHCPARPVRFALEMQRGWFAQHGIAPGSALVQPRLFRAPPAGR